MNHASLPSPGISPAAEMPAAATVSAVALAPAAEWFPDFPQTWYLLGPARQLRERPQSFGMFGRRLVAFRGQGGVPALIDAECAHMGNYMDRGRVVDGCIECPFHGWRYDGSGQCAKIPAQAEIPAATRRRAFPVAERHGLLFAHFGSRPRFDVPQFFQPSDVQLVPGRPVRYTMGSPWWVFAANGFDMQHFALVHDRQVIGEPQVDSPDPFGRRIQLDFRVTGKSLADRFIRTFLGDRAHVSITVWGGNLVGVTARFPRTVSRLLFASHPDGRQRTQATLVVFAERGSRYTRWMVPLSLWVRRLLTTAFVRDDTNRVTRAIYRPESLIAADRVMIDYYRWLAALCSTEESES